MILCKVEMIVWTGKDINSSYKYFILIPSLLEPLFIAIRRIQCNFLVVDSVLVSSLIPLIHFFFLQMSYDYSRYSLIVIRVFCYPWSSFTLHFKDKIIRYIKMFTSDKVSKNCKALRPFFDLPFGILISTQPLSQS